MAEWLNAAVLKCLCLTNKTLAEEADLDWRQVTNAMTHGRPLRATTANRLLKAIRRAPIKGFTSLQKEERQKLARRLGVALARATPIDIRDAEIVPPALIPSWAYAAVADYVAQEMARKPGVRASSRARLKRQILKVLDRCAIGMAASAAQSFWRQGKASGTKADRTTALIMEKFGYSFRNREAKRSRLKQRPGC